MRTPFTFLLLLLFLSVSSQAQAPWAVSTYPDEPGFTQRKAGMLPRIANLGYAERGKATSKCPDTGLEVKTWAMEGDTIISPYTGTQYLQGNVGYFGPEARNKQGQITAFGGDPLKYELTPATAELLMNPTHQKAKAFLGIPGNLNQQYHFAAVNWARFYPLLAPQMGADWKKAFHRAVANYSEKRRPSDGPDREHAYLSHAHNLIGEPGELLGGNKLDGGTENHKTMWRTSGLLYSQLFPKRSKVSGYPLKKAEKLTTRMIREYLQIAMHTGNGEYDSRIYYPYSFRAFLNLYDFSPRAETQELGKIAMDYYLATSGLKVMDGLIAGAQKRGFPLINKPSGYEKFIWGWTGQSSRNMQKVNPLLTLHQTTTSYRPNKIIYNIITKNIPLPFEAQMARPSYHSDQANVFQESFYCAHNYALGNIAMTRVDNPPQQTIWSLVARGTDGPLVFGGVQPYWKDAEGHSPYTQTLHKKSAQLVVTGQTGNKPSWGMTKQQDQRFANASETLKSLDVPQNLTPETLRNFWEQARYSAATWFFVPRKISETQIKEKDGKIFIQANQTLLAVHPLGEGYTWLTPGRQMLEKLQAKTFRPLQHYRILVIKGAPSGFVLQAGEMSEYGSLESFINKVEDETSVNSAALESNGTLGYTSLEGDELLMQYQPTRLRAKGKINGKTINYNNWADGGVIQSPYVTVKDTTLSVNDGNKGYHIHFSGKQPRFEPFNP